MPPGLSPRLLAQTGPWLVVACLLGAEFATLLPLLRGRSRGLPGAIRSRGIGPGLARLALESQVLTGLLLVLWGSLGLRLGLLGGALTGLLLDATSLALACFLGLLVLGPRLEELSDWARGKRLRALGGEEISLVALPGGQEDPRLVSSSALARLDRWVEGALFPAFGGESESRIELLGARLDMDRGSPCRVCGEPLGEEPLVLCGKCRTPHHRGCFEYVGGCSTYGCGCRDSLPVEAEAPEDREPGDPDPRAPDA